MIFKLLEKVRRIVSVYWSLFDLRSYGKRIYINGYCDVSNFGDALNVSFIEGITKKKVINSNRSIRFFLKRKDIYTVIGSIIDNGSVDRTTIWGSGLINKESFDISAIKPKKICAVRGPLTRKILVENGLDCPEIYGDPALLLNRLYNPKIDKKYKLGVIPHYVDKEHDIVKELSGLKDVLVIDVNVGQKWKQFVNNIVSCEKVFSSSLHGIIVSDAYEIPSKWIEFSKDVIGEGFKFIDYFMSVNRKDREPVSIQNINDLNGIEIEDYTIDIDLEKLINSCPFQNSLK